MKQIYTILLIFLAVSAMRAQSEGATASAPTHKIVFHLSSNDTLVHKALIKQVGHILIAAPDARIEVVCHSNGITLLQRAMTSQAAGVQDLKQKGVDFAACENTMRDRKIKKEDLLSDCRTVPSGLMEIIMKQEQQWTYIKAGF
jgi:hypothetical protein